MLFLLASFPKIKNGISPATIPGCKIIKNKFRRSRDTIVQFVKVNFLQAVLCPVPRDQR